MPTMQATSNVHTIPLMLVVNPGYDIRTGLEEALLSAFPDQSAHSLYSRPLRKEHPRMIAHPKPCFQLIVIDMKGIAPQSRESESLVPDWLREDILKRVRDACVVLLTPDDLSPHNQMILNFAFRKLIGECELLSRDAILKDMTGFADQIRNIWTSHKPHARGSFWDFSPGFSEGD